MSKLCVTSYIDTATSKCVACPAGTQIYSNPYLWENWGNKWANGACTTQNTTRIIQVEIDIIVLNEENIIKNWKECSMELKLWVLINVK